MTLPPQLQLMTATLAALEAEQRLDEAADQLYKALVATGDQGPADRLYQVLAGLRRVLTDVYALAMDAAATAEGASAAAERDPPLPAEEVASG